ncbi:phytoene/squalene synthase family protein [Sphingomonas gilva]|uniref:Phytoene/squalene synthase family protein n=1 Tax=Sphingomonas gilva TaxID=2305907 RepID=A0A396RSP8_9SPHN|nr:phytoene/squalene synthase family protein [Sphingomonas gilva]
MASRLFDRRTRERAWLLYAWARACDDLADGQAMGHDMTAVADPAARLALIRELTARALAGEPVGHPAFDALRYLVAECPVPHGFIDDVIAGFARDAEEWRPRSETDMLGYCYHVAGAIGCAMAVVMGVSPGDSATLDRASDLGIAFQLANIARDVEEDDRVGRCYLPEEWLVEMDMPPGQHMKPPFRARLAVLAKRLAGMAAAYRASAAEGAQGLPFRSRWAVLAASEIYGAIARKVAERGEHAWDHRVVVGRAEKLALAAKAGAAALNQRTPRPRDAELWTRPDRG